MASPLRRVGVLGMGLMGNGIAQITCAVASLPVVAYDVSPDAVARGRAAISKSLAALASKQVAKGALDRAGADAYLARAEANLTTSTDLGALGACDIVIEAAPEAWELKRKLYSGLAGRLAPTAVLASNTSGLLIADLAREFGAPERVLGLHYFNPVPLMALCEVIATPQTAPWAIEAATALVRAQGKTAVQAKDSPGFVVNRLLVPFLAQAIRLHSEGVASTGDIDAAMKLGCGHPMGPLQLADYVGLDTTLFILRNWTAKYPGEPAFLCVCRGGGAVHGVALPSHCPFSPPPPLSLPHLPAAAAASPGPWRKWWPGGTWGARAAGAFTPGRGTRWWRRARHREEEKKNRGGGACRAPLKLKVGRCHSCVLFVHSRAAARARLSSAADLTAARVASTASPTASSSGRGTASESEKAALRSVSQSLAPQALPAHAASSVACRSDGAHSTSTKDSRR